MNDSKNQESIFSYAADSTSRALRATCLSLPIDEQSFYLAVRFLQCVKLTEENKFIFQTTLTEDDRIWIKEKERQAILLELFALGNGKSQTQTTLYALATSQANNQLTIEIIYDKEGSRYERVESAIQAYRKTIAPEGIEALIIMYRLTPDEGNLSYWQERCFDSSFWGSKK